MSLRKAYELSKKAKHSISELSSCLEEYNPGRCKEVSKLVPLNELSFDTAIVISELEKLRSLISNIIIEGEN